MSPKQLLREPLAQFVLIGLLLFLIHGWVAPVDEASKRIVVSQARVDDMAREYRAQLGSAPTQQQLAGLVDTYVHDEILYREGAVLVTDYSSCFFDFMLTGKPAVSFAYDLDRYAEVERGLFYDLDQVFPGPVCRDFGSLRKALESVFDPPSPDAAAALEWRRAMFFDHVDDGSSARVAERVRALMDDDAVGKEFT